ncbi:MAG: restriction endonuclease subunit S [Bryobacteraceae bacterium]|nr:restriction endonuclease subunit S [Solibacteraceae bacterium]MCO5353275.1 restriction endonuclease subunit S [Bryobacteraceae bacterium]
MTRRVKLKEVCREITVGHVGPMADQYVENGIPFLRSQNVMPFRLDGSNLKYISDSFHQRLKKSALGPGDVVVVRTGYPGTACVIPDRLLVANCADLVVIRPSSEINGHFLSCIFNSAWGKSAVAGSLVGVAQQHFNIGVAKEMLINLPPIEVQQRIASILSAYDDLIENNTRRIKILEEMAQRIYREWFVHFRFPGHENVRMVESELGPIPEGWASGVLRDVCESVDYGYTTSAIKEAVGPKFLRITDIVPQTIDWRDVPHCKAPEKNADRYRLREGDIVVARTGATTGYAKRLNKHHPLAIFASYLVRLRIKPQFSNCLYGVLAQSDDYKNFIKANWSGAAQPQANAQVLTSIPIVIPPPQLHQTFSALAEPILDMSENLQIRNANLRATRDLLLPKLISGEISVEALEPELVAPTS